MTIRIFVADDHPLIRDGIRSIVTKNGNGIEIVGETDDGFKALEFAKRGLADVFILDIVMPRLNGLDAAREICRMNNPPKVIMLSVHAGCEYVEQAMKAGASWYLTKETAGQNLMEAVKEVHAGRSYLSPEIAHCMKKNGLKNGESEPAAKNGSALTSREHKVLKFIAEGQTSKEIAVSLNVSNNTVNTHRKNLMIKVGLHKVTDLVRYAIKEGIVTL